MKNNKITIATRIALFIMLILMVAIGFFAINTEKIACNVITTGGFIGGGILTFKLEPLYCD